LGAVSQPISIKGGPRLFAADLLEIAVNTTLPELRLEGIKRHDAFYARESISIQMKLDAAILRLRNFYTEGLAGSITIRRDNASSGPNAGGCEANGSTGIGYEWEELGLQSILSGSQKSLRQMGKTFAVICNHKSLKPRV